MTLRHICKNLLPRDTRAVEIASAWAMIMLSPFLLISSNSTGAMRELHPVEFWAAFTIIFGTLHLYSLVRYTYEEPVRIAISWVSGSFWIWLSLAGGLNTPGDIATLVLGVSCMCAFLINTVILSESWGK